MKKEIFEGLKEFIVSIAAYIGAFLASFILVGAIELFMKLFE